jgi:hypothetical protein
LQQAVLAHEDSSPAHSPATAAGPLLHAGKAAAAEPVQKQDACS